MPHLNPESTNDELTPHQMRVLALGEAILNVDLALSPKPPVQLPNLPGVAFFGKDLKG